MPLPERAGATAIERAIEKAISAAALRVALRGSLKKHRGCIHWHVKNGDASGTLEITFWPEKRRAWFTIQKARRAAWITQKLPLIRRLVQQHLN
jgi:hypothetical protein